MEEARLDLMSQLNFDYIALEKRNIISPVTKLSCTYKVMAQLDSLFEVKVAIVKFTDIILGISYEINDAKTNIQYAIGETQHCFLLKDSHEIIKLSNYCPELYQKLLQFKELCYDYADKELEYQSV
jgi:acyl-CoA thioester hydrolase